MVQKKRNNPLKYCPSFEFEHHYPSPVAGLDEAGCGAWAGPVIAGAVILLPSCPVELLEQLNDSKQLTPQKREEVFDLLRANSSHIHIGIGAASVQEIESLNIRASALLAMKRAFDHLPISAQAALIDGNVNPKLGCQTALIIKGDQRSYSIAAASIVAKVSRDRLMKELSKEHPEFGWEKNAGYGTALHQNALATFGITPHHRRTYKPIAALLTLHDKSLFS